MAGRFHRDGRVYDDNGTQDGLHDLTHGPQDLVGRSALIGLHVEPGVNALLASETRLLDPHSVQALLDAVKEALANAARHSGADHAVVRACTMSDMLEISIADHARRLDPDKPAAGPDRCSTIVARPAIGIRWSA